MAAIHVAPAKGEPMVSVPEVLAVEGRGIEGDRYFLGTGQYSAKPGPHRQITLIEAEALEALRGELGIELSPAESRRNLLTEGVPLNHLVGREFRAGGTRLLGIKLCEPCAYLEGRTKNGVLSGLVHRGGLRAQILSTGRIRVGDPVEPTSAPSPT